MFCLQGDSGFIVVRNGQIALRSSPKQHFFDCPLQFGSYPEHVDGTDTADDAELYQLPVEVGDIIIAGTVLPEQQLSFQQRTGGHVHRVVVDCF